MPDTPLITTVAADLRASLDGLESGMQSVDDWHEETVTLISVGHTAAYMDGSGKAYADLSNEDLATIQARVQGELAYLDAFADVIQAGSESGQLDWDKWRARAASYAKALKATESAGKTALWRLPAQPGQDSPCLSSCQCVWDVQVLSEEELNADAFWRLGGAEHCPTCTQRAARWNPLQIRGGQYNG